MSPAKLKPHPKKRQRQFHKWLIIIPVLVVILVTASAAFLLNQTSPSTTNLPSPTYHPTVPQGLQQLADHYLTIMHDLNSSQTRTQMANRVNGDYNQTELFNWEANRMSFGDDETGYYEAPLRILDSGKGVCFQWSIVYVSACLSEGYQSRLVASVDTSTWTAIHMWAEDNYNGSWVHVDPSDRVWNNPSRYQTWPWGAGLGSTVKVYAFEDGAFHDVTATYVAK